MSEASRPILFLDVDGVINAFDPVEDHETRLVPFTTEPLRLSEIHFIGADAGRSAESVPVPIKITSGCVQRLKTLHERFEIVMATAWFHGGVVLLKELGLDHPFEVLEWSDLKLERIPGFAGETPWAFIDDDISFELRGLSKKSITWETPDHALLIETDGNEGITDEHVDELLRFAERFTQSPEPGSDRRGR